VCCAVVAVVDDVAVARSHGRQNRFREVVYCMVGEHMEGLADENLVENPCFVVFRVARPVEPQEYHSSQDVCGWKLVKGP